MNFSQQNQNYRQFNAAPVSLFLHLQLLISSYIWTHCRLESILMLDFRSNLMIWNPSLSASKIYARKYGLVSILVFSLLSPKKIEKKIFGRDFNSLFFFFLLYLFQREETFQSVFVLRFEPRPNLPFFPSSPVMSVCELV